MEQLPATTAAQLVNRGYNLMITAFLFFVGLAMGSNAIPEGDFSDKIDDLGLLAVGLVAAGWYLAGSGRSKRTPVPIALALLAVAVQIVGVVLEIGDKASFGDNIGGMLMLVPLALFAIWQYVRAPALAENGIPGPRPRRTAGAGVAP